MGEIGDFGTHAEFCELLMAWMMICATVRITGSEEWRKIGKTDLVEKIILKWNGSKKE